MAKSTALYAIKHDGTFEFIECGDNIDGMKKRVKEFAAKGEHKDYRQIILLDGNALKSCKLKPVLSKSEQDSLAKKKESEAKEFKKAEDLKKKIRDGEVTAEEVAAYKKEQEEKREKIRLEEKRIQREALAKARAHSAEVRKRLKDEARKAKLNARNAAKDVKEKEEKKK